MGSLILPGSITTKHSKFCIVCLVWEICGYFSLSWLHEEAEEKKKKRVLLLSWFLVHTML